MRSSVPDGDLAAVVEAAVSGEDRAAEGATAGGDAEAADDARPQRHAPRPAPHPAAVKRAVRARDGDRCAYVDPQGRRCGERRGLQFHHRHPHGYGGDRSVDNIALRCGGHNRYEAEGDYGRRSDGGETRPRGPASGCRVTGSAGLTAGPSCGSLVPRPTGAPRRGGALGLANAAEATQGDGSFTGGSGLSRTISVETCAPALASIVVRPTPASPRASRTQAPSGRATVATPVASVGAPAVGSAIGDRHR